MSEPFPSGRARPRGRSLPLAFGSAAGRDAIEPVGEAGFLFMMRTRSTAILGFGEMLADGSLTLTPSRRAEYAGIIRREGRALDQAIRDFLGDERAGDDLAN